MTPSLEVSSTTSASVPLSVTPYHATLCYFCHCLITFYQYFVYVSTCLLLLSLPPTHILEGKFLGNRDFCLFCLLLFPQNLA